MNIKAMKQPVIMIAMICLVMIASSFAGKDGRSGVVAIKDVRQTHAPVPDAAHHKYHDVEVYRTKDGDAESYLVYIYRKEADTIKCYKNALSVKSKPDMDKAAYNWLNDTMVSIRLYNSTSKKEVSCEVYGHGKMHGIYMK